MSTDDPRDPVDRATSHARRLARDFGKVRTFAEYAAWKPLIAVYASIPLAVLAIIWLGGDGKLGTTPIWILVVILAITSVANMTSFLWLRARPGPGVPMQVRLAVSAFSTAAVIYAAGWGSIIVIGYAVGVAEIVRSNGSATWRGALGWNAAAILCGEIAIQLHWAPSIVAVGTAHEAAIFGFACLALVTRVLVLTSGTAEMAEARLRERSERFESLVAHASDVIGAVDGRGNITFLSPAIETLLGYTPAELEGTQLVDVIDTDDAHEVRRILDELSASPNAIDRRDDVRFRHRVGHERRVVVTFTSRDAGGDDALVINLHDVTVERALEDRLRFDAMHDPLTGTWNRPAFTEATENACASSARDGGTIALLFVDVDGFKQINDTLGHDRGDELLTHVARSIQSCLRAGNILGRWGGDEFVVLLTNVNHPEDAIAVADRILAELDGVTLDPAVHPRTTVSIGIATSTNGTHSAATLARLADEAMYTAKHDGRARWALSPASPHVPVSSHPSEERAQAV
jgi:diguanylate cyclase (GGDEF)-like protein/PAS domain S-box-containing protein